MGLLASLRATHDRRTAARYAQHWKWNQIDEAVQKSFEKTSILSKIRGKFKRDDVEVSNSVLLSPGPARRKSLLGRMRRPSFNLPLETSASATEGAADANGRLQCHCMLGIVVLNFVCATTPLTSFSASCITLFHCYDAR